MRKRRHWFQYASVGFLFLFLGMLCLTIVVAYSRRSGSTGMDVATIQKIRYEAINPSTSQRDAPP